jgi:hypothetical protein
MRKFLGNYVPEYAPSFSEQLVGMPPKFIESVKKKIEALSNDPYHNTRFMKGQHKGKRKARLNDSDRLVFVICEECRELGHWRYNRCRDCATTPENTLVIAYIIFGHDYKRGFR